MDDFKQGKFKTVLEDNKTESFAIRNDSIQIEDFNGKMDTFNIKWLDQFEYVLTKRVPKTLLDSTPFYVKITSVKENSYSFNAYYKGSNFKQKGTAFKLE
jgi:hypothetical protein